MKIKSINNPLGVLLITMSGSLVLYLLRQYFKDVPCDLIFGPCDFRIFLIVLFPISWAVCVMVLINYLVRNSVRNILYIVGFGTLVIVLVPYVIYAREDAVGLWKFNQLLVVAPFIYLVHYYIFGNFTGQRSYLNIYRRLLVWFIVTLTFLGIGIGIGVVWNKTQLEKVKQQIHTFPVIENPSQFISDFTPDEDYRYHPAGAYLTSSPYYPFDMLDNLGHINQKLASIDNKPCTQYRLIEADIRWKVFWVSVLGCPDGKGYQYYGPYRYIDFTPIVQQEKVNLDDFTERQFNK